jgi:hypothetical protein
VIHFGTASPGVGAISEKPRRRSLLALGLRSNAALDELEKPSLAAMATSQTE